MITEEQVAHYQTLRVGEAVVSPQALEARKARLVPRLREAFNQPATRMYLSKRWAICFEEGKPLALVIAVNDSPRS